MKRNIILITIGFIICTAFNEPLYTDYRDAYTGNYFCHTSSSRFNPYGSPNVMNDTITISISKDDVLDSVIEIAVGRNTHKFKLSNGLMTSYPVERRDGGRFFAADSIFFYVSFGHSSEARYTGKKK